MGNDMFDLIAGDDYVNHAKTIMEEIERNELEDKMNMSNDKEYYSNYMDMNYNHIQKKMINKIIEKKIANLHVSSSKNTSKNNKENGMQGIVVDNAEDSIEDVRLAEEINKLGLCLEDITDNDLRVLDNKINNNNEDK